MSDMKLIMERFEKAMSEQMPQRTDTTTGTTMRGCRGDDQSRYCQIIRRARQNFDGNLARAAKDPKYQKLRPAMESGLTPKLRDLWFEKIVSVGIDPSDPDPPAMTPEVLDELLKSVSPTFKNFSIETREKYLGFLEDEDGESTVYGKFLESIARSLATR